MGEAILTLENLSKFYTSAQNVVVGLNNVSLSFERGEFVAITGESGSGKSTLAHVVGGILPFESGELIFNGMPTSHFDGRDWEAYRRDNISFISQSYGILLSSTVQENVISALRLTGMEKKDAIAQAEVILKKVELWELRRRRAAKLSSGQKQRLSIARALAKPAPILIADEPTGNLDPENSAKVIELLAEAAKDRLVLLITHDFQEAEDCATRRINLQDGRVIMDAPLKPPVPPEPLPERKSKKKKALSFYVSRLQLGGRPVWGTMVLLFFALTAFAVFAFLGTFIVSLDDTNTRIYDKTAFNNGDKLRIVVQRTDKADMTGEDYEKLLDTAYVTGLEKYGFLSDIYIFYQEDVDYKASYYLENVGTSVDPVYEQRMEIRLWEYESFAKTVPLMKDPDSFLTAGRMPENISEVVLVGDESLIDPDTTLRIFLQDSKNWATTGYIYLDGTVVGVTDQGTGVYFHEDVGRIFTHNNDGSEYQFLYVPDRTLEDNLALMGCQGIRIPNTVPLRQTEAGEIYFGLPTVDGMELETLLSGTSQFTYAASLAVSPGDFEKLTPTGAGNQVSLTIKDYAYTGRVLEAVQEMGYVAVSPYQLGATTQIAELANQRIQTLLICLAALIVVFALQIIVLRAMFGSETENYKLLANIGLTCKTAKRSVLWQILLFTVLGQAIGFAGLWICNEQGVERIVNIVKYLPPALMLVLSAAHLMAALLAALWIAGSIRKKVYPLQSQRDDVDLDIEDEEVAV